MNLTHEGTVLVTGAIGFIGYHLCDRLLSEGCDVIGIDNINDYYDPRLKQARLALLDGRRNFSFYKLDIADRSTMPELFRTVKPTVVVNLAAQAGVRYSLRNPHAYIDANLVGFVNILEGCRHTGVRHLVYASSSSVYGLNTKMPFSVHDNVDHPVSLYSATKKANELIAHSYSRLYGLPTTGLRFFTVYGPWGRPDMSMFIFAKHILRGEPLPLFNYGDMRRDFTYIEDVVEAVRRVQDKVPEPDPHWNASDPDPGTSRAPHRIYNIGGSSPVEITMVVDLLERSLGRRTERILLPMEPGDVPGTSADTEDLADAIGFRPAIPIEIGVRKFAAWFAQHGMAFA